MDTILYLCYMETENSFLHFKTLFHYGFRDYFLQLSFRCEWDEIFSKFAEFTLIIIHYTQITIFAYGC